MKPKGGFLASGFSGRWLLLMSIRMDSWIFSLYRQLRVEAGFG
jgi:hypothetical protein